MTYTRDELTAKLVGMIEPMPSQPSIYYTVSPMGLWVYVSRQWIPARTIRPLHNIGDTIRCAEAAGCDWTRNVCSGGHDWFVYGMDSDAAGRYVQPFTDNDHALALALAVASAVDGERAEVA